jgi:hypothetical protein
MICVAGRYLSVNTWSETPVGSFNRCHCIYPISQHSRHHISDVTAPTNVTCSDVKRLVLTSQNSSYMLPHEPGLFGFGMYATWIAAKIIRHPFNLKNKASINITSVNCLWKQYVTAMERKNWRLKLSELMTGHNKTKLVKLITFISAISPAFNII